MPILSPGQPNFPEEPLTREQAADHLVTLANQVLANQTAMGEERILWREPRPRRGLLGRLALALRQFYCPHPTATAARIPGTTPAVYWRHCWRCDRQWAEGEG